MTKITKYFFTFLLLYSLPLTANDSDLNTFPVQQKGFFQQSVFEIKQYLILEIAKIDKDKIINPNFNLDIPALANINKPPCSAPTFDFQNSTRLSGSQGAVGSTYRFDDVLAGTDAILTIVSKSHSDIVINSLDEQAATNGGYDEAFQPIIDFNWVNGTFNGAGDKEVTFQFDFVDGSTGNPVSIADLSMTAVDVDGDSRDIREYVETSGFSQYQTQSPTNLTLSGSLKARGSYATFNGVQETAFPTMITFGYQNISTITLKVGANYDGGNNITTGSEARLSCIYFKCYEYNTVLPCPTLAIVGNEQICNGATTTLTASPIGGSGTCNLKWQSSLNGINWYDISGATANIHTTPAINTTTYYRAAYTCSGNTGCGTIYSNIKIITLINCPENCSNGIDDDGDGSIDCIDTDCSCTNRIDTLPCFIIGDGAHSEGTDIDSLYSVDPFTGQVIAIGQTGTYKMEAMAINPTDGIMYGLEGSKLGTLNLTTGLFTPITLNHIGDLDGAQGTIYVNDVDGLSYDVANNILWASGRLDGQSGDEFLPNDIIFKINPANGLPIYNAFGTNVDYLTVFTNEGDLDDIAITNDGILYAISNRGGSGNQMLGTINTQNGNWNPIGDYGISDVEGMTVTASGQLMVTTGDNGSHRNSLYTIDPLTAEAIFIGSLGTAADVEGCACKHVNYANGIIGGKIWRDEDSDGIRDNGEPTLSSITVNLLDGSGNPVLDNNGIAHSTVSDGNGFYKFSGLNSGYYIVQVIPLSGQSFTLQNVGGNDDLDSDVQLGNGLSDSYSLLAGQHIDNIDAGLLPIGTTIEICDNGMDDDGDGLADCDDPDCITNNSGTADFATTTINEPVTLALLNNDQVTTGNYTFNLLSQPSFGTLSNIATGVYSYTPTGVGTDQFQYELCFTCSCDTINVTIEVDCEPIPGQNIITGKIFNDTDDDGFADVGETYQAGKIIELYEDINNDGFLDGGDILLNINTSSPSGYYSFSPALNQVAVNTSSRINESENDAMEKDDDSMDDVNKSEVKFKDDRPWNGLRFTDVNIPAGSVITSAYIQLYGKSDKDEFTPVDIFTALNVNAAFFEKEDFNISGRARSSNSVYWNVPEVFQDVNYNTPDVANLIQEVVDLPDWENGNQSIIFLINTTIGERVFSSFDDDPDFAPLLVVNYLEPIKTNYLVHYNETYLANNEHLTTTQTHAISFSNLGENDCLADFGLNGTEICGNLMDDDGDNLIDNADPDCTYPTIVAIDDYGSTAENTPISVFVLQNDIGALVYSSINNTSVLAPANGSITNINTTNGAITYLPNTDFVGTDFYEYIICNNQSLCDTALVTILVNCGDHAGQNDIMGSVFKDSNRNGVMDNAEIGQSGITVRLYEDVNQNGLADGGDNVVQTMNTTANGSYKFTTINNYVGTYTGGIIQEEDDARDGNDGENKLVLGKDKVIGLRFTGINIPANAVIDSAFISFVAKGDKTNEPSIVNIYGDDQASPNDYHPDDEVALRPKTSAFINWTITPWIEDTTYQSLNIKTVVQELINKHNAYTNGEMAFIFDSVGEEEREAKSYETNDDGTDVPTLQIYYTIPVDYYYVVEIDTLSLPNFTSVTTPTITTALFSELGATVCGNNFGFAVNEEICDNNIDDDGDLLVDENDPDCCVNAPIFPNKIGDQVWLDINADGDLDSLEIGLSNVEIFLTNQTLIKIEGVIYVPGAYMDTAFTNANGFYDFEDVPDGDWQVVLNIDTTIYTPIYDADGDTLTITNFTINNGLVSTGGNFWCATADCNLDIDFGLTLNGNHQLGGTVCIDDDEDGVCNTGGETFFQNVKILIYDNTGMYLGGVLTAANGSYLFPVLPDGSYTLSLNTNQTDLNTYHFTTQLGDTPASSILHTSSGIIFQEVPVMQDVFGVDFGFTLTPCIIDAIISTYPTGVNNNLCEGVAYTFAATDAGVGVNYNWNFGNNANLITATGIGPHNVQFTASSSTLPFFPEVILTVNENGCQNSDTLNLTFHPAINITTVTPTNPGNCNGSNGAIDLTVVGEQNQCFEVSLDGGSSWKANNKTTFNGLNAGSYDLAIRYCNTDCPNSYGLITLSDPTAVIAMNDTLPNLCPGIEIQGNVAQNDSNLANTVFSIITTPANGMVTFESNGTFVYNSITAICGNDQFSYQVCDQNTFCCAVASVTLIFGDTTKPTLINIPPDETIHCDETISSPPLVSAFDNCPAISISVAEASNQGEDGCSLYDYVLTRTWTATDVCGNSTSAQQVINVEDVIAPDIYKFYRLPNGKNLVAGVMEGVSTNWKVVNLPLDFATKPLILTQITSNNETTPVVVQLRNVSVAQFEVRIKEEEGTDNLHLRENISWVAIETGVQTGDYQLEAGLQLLNDTYKSSNFLLPFVSPPAFFASSQTVYENDPVSIKQKSITSTSFELHLVEETSADIETTHINEQIGYVAIENLAGITDEKGRIFGETKTTTLSDNWMTFNLEQAYFNPVVIMNTASENELEANIIRVRNVTSTSFEARIEEWENEDDTHTPEAVSYMVVEGSIPIDIPNFCETGTDSLIIGIDMKAIDNCDASVIINYSEIDLFFGAKKITHREWTATDECGNETAYTQDLICEGVSLQLKSFLQGALLRNNQDGLMRDDLRKKGLIPLKEPYSKMANFTHVNGGGNEKVDSSLLTITGQNGIVDWVFIELRAANNIDSVIATSSGMIQCDGDVISAKGDSILNFLNTPVGNYYVSIRHRNHLGMVTMNPITFSTTLIPFVDFAFAFTPIQGSSPKVKADGQEAMWSGDLNGDGKIIYQGPNNDVFQMFLHVVLDEDNQSYLTNYITRGYTKNDFNLDGTVIFQGPNNDRALLLFNTTLKHPDNPQQFSNFIIRVDIDP